MNQTPDPFAVPPSVADFNAFARKFGEAMTYYEDQIGHVMNNALVAAYGMGRREPAPEQLPIEGMAVRYTIVDEPVDAMDEYQRGSAGTAIYPEAGTGSILALAYVGLGLASEAGELAGKIKKVLRDEDGQLSDSRAAELEGELGDVLWYVARMADELGAGLSDIARGNLAKLADRKARGVLSGSGDQR